jgi:hypothetical protein
MATFRFSITTTATPQQAVAYLADLRNLPDWVREVDRVEATADGYEAHLDRLLLPDLVIAYTVTRGDGVVVADGTSPSADLVDRWEVTPSGDGAEVDYVGTLELKGVTKLAGPLAGLAGDARATGLAQALRERLDALAGAPAA